MGLRDWGMFLCEFIRHPTRIGAVGPSSQRLARSMVGGIDWSSVKTVLEYGPGTGVFTRQILQVKAADARLVAVEFNRRFADELRPRVPEADVVCGDVGQVCAICAERGIQAADVIICGLPWASFSSQRQIDYLEATMQVLRPGGHFRTFAYVNGMLLPTAHRFRRLLGDYFSVCRRGPIVWGNVPPAFVYQCQR